MTFELTKTVSFESSLDSAECQTVSILLLSVKQRQLQLSENETIANVEMRDKIVAS